MISSVKLLEVAIHRLTANDAILHIVTSSRSGVGGWVVTPNLDILRRLVVDESFSRLCEGCTLRLADGMPLIWASRLQRTPLPERVAGSDLIWLLTAAAAKDGLRVFLLGGNPGAAEGAARILGDRFPQLVVAGTLCPSMGFEKDPDQIAMITQTLLTSNPQIVYVALGSPKQEHLIHSLRQSLPSAWFLGIGISFSFVTGEVSRAPAWMRKTGLEWMHRLIHDPRRLFRRYLIDGIPFALRLFIVSGAHGITGKELRRQP